MDELEEDVLETDKELCVFRTRLGWYYWNESEMVEDGPFTTKEEAARNCAEYAKRL